MAYETGTASSIEDLMQAFYDFALANGWTGNIFSAANDWCAINNGTEFFQFRWNNIDAVAMFHSTAFVNTSTAPGNHTGSSGLGQIDASAPYNGTISDATTSTANRQQLRLFTNNAITAYHFFAPASGTKYIHVVVERTPGGYSHMSIGSINKRGTWTGGGYSSGSRVSSSASYSARSGPFGTGATRGFLGTCMFAIRAQGLPGQAAATRWAVNASYTTAVNTDMDDDAAGNVRSSVVLCGVGQGLFGPFMGMPADPAAGLTPLLPIEIYHTNNVTTDDNRSYLLGYIPDAFIMNMLNYSAGQEFTVGANTYMVFPPAAKGSNTPGDVNRGIAYLKAV